MNKYYQRPELNRNENEVVKKLALKFLDNRSKRQLKIRGLPWSVDTDALVYIDDEGADTAFGDGAEIVLNKHLTEIEIEKLSNSGYLIKGECIFAFSRFLLENFIKASLLLNFSENSRKKTEYYLNELVTEINEEGGCSVDGEVIKPPKQLKDASKSK